MDKLYIEENLLTDRGRLNGNKTKNLSITNEEIYLIYHNIEKPVCECGNEVNFLGFSRGYNKTCGYKCGNNKKDKKIKEKKTKLKNHPNGYSRNHKKAEETCISKYGVKHFMMTDEGKEKCKKTKTEKYGDEKYNNREKSKKTKTEKYGDPTYTNRDKAEETIYKKYGVKNIMQTGEVEFGYKYKNYILPSGKKIKIQGYEDRLLDELLDKFNEDEILTDRKDMPEFWYIGEDNKEHRYFPDVFIPHINTIYEVKSTYTITCDIEKNKKKFKSVKDAGYNFELKVY